MNSNPKRSPKLKMIAAVAGGAVVILLMLAWWWLAQDETQTFFRPAVGVGKKTAEEYAYLTEMRSPPAIAPEPEGTDPNDEPFVGEYADKIGPAKFKIGPDTLELAAIVLASPWDAPDKTDQPAPNTKWPVSKVLGPDCAELSPQARAALPREALEPFDPLPYPEWQLRFFWHWNGQPWTNIRPFKIFDANTSACLNALSNYDLKWLNNWMIYEQQIPIDLRPISLIMDIGTHSISFQRILSFTTESIIRIPSYSFKFRPGGYQPDPNAIQKDLFFGMNCWPSWLNGRSTFTLMCSGGRQIPTNGTDEYGILRFLNAVSANETTPTQIRITVPKYMKRIQITFPLGKIPSPKDYLFDQRVRQWTFNKGINAFDYATDCAELKLVGKGELTYPHKYMNATIGDILNDTLSQKGLYLAHGAGLEDYELKETA